MVFATEKYALVRRRDCVRELIFYFGMNLNYLGPVSIPQVYYLCPVYCIHFRQYPSEISE